MKVALLISGVGIALVILTPAFRALRSRSSSRMSDDEYFAAARKRAIGYRLGKADTRKRARGIASAD